MSKSEQDNSQTIVPIRFTMKVTGSLSDPKKQMLAIRREDDPILPLPSISTLSALTPLAFSPLQERPMSIPPVEKPPASLARQPASPLQELEVKVPSYSLVKEFTPTIQEEATAGLGETGTSSYNRDIGSPKNSRRFRADSRSSPALKAKDLKDGASKDFLMDSFMQVKDRSYTQENSSRKNSDASRRTSISAANFEVETTSGPLWKDIDNVKNESVSPRCSNIDSRTDTFRDSCLSPVDSIGPNERRLLDSLPKADPRYHSVRQCEILRGSKSTYTSKIIWGASSVVQLSPSVNSGAGFYPDPESDSDSDSVPLKEKG
ncbi:hypothetical protein BIW11_07902 [Tropilaelaps mercedesae]|uniref:Uncharacterized protein n=1 Tax=Tropilaelaps mercedesae TaxID=418985 RepID=A0A1V9XRW6_9ACAR|nr:hypothetical protein BIW11_07902 [Tropilaelaps mercedesae]